MWVAKGKNADYQHLRKSFKRSAKKGRLKSILCGKRLTLSHTIPEAKDPHRWSFTTLLENEKINADKGVTLSHTIRKAKDPHGWSFTTLLENEKINANNQYCLLSPYSLP